TREGRQTVLEILRLPEYRSFIIARFFYIIAQRMVTTIVVWLMFLMTHDAFAIGLVGLFEFVPAFCFALYAGHVIDKSDKRRLLLFTTCCYLACVAGLITLFAGPFIRIFGFHGARWIIYVIIFMTGVIRAFGGPALNAIVAQIVPRKQLPSA